MSIDRLVEAAQSDPEQARHKLVLYKEDGICWVRRGETPLDNAAMAKTTAERQADFKQAMKDAGYVRLEAYVTKEQREKFRALGGDEWLRKKIDKATVKDGGNA